MLTPRMERALDSFQYRVAQQLTRRQPRRPWGCYLVLPTIGGGNWGIRFLGDQGIHHEEAEHGCTVYCDATNYGPL